MSSLEKLINIHFRLLFASLIFAAKLRFHINLDFTLRIKFKMNISLNIDLFSFYQLFELVLR